MSRSTMADLIGTLRGMTNAGFNSYTLGTVTFWDDDQLQAALDRARGDVHRERLEKVQQPVGGGTVEWREYRASYANLEATDGGTAVFVLRDTTGAIVDAADYSVDYARGVVTFGANTGGTTYELTGRSYDLNRAAADVWRTKATHLADTAFDFSTDNHSVSRSQLYRQALQQADYYSSLGGASVVRLFRSDASWG